MGCLFRELLPFSLGLALKFEITLVKLASGGLNAVLLTGWWLLVCYCEETPPSIFLLSSFSAIVWES